MRRVTSRCSAKAARMQSFINTLRQVVYGYDELYPTAPLPEDVRFYREPHRTRYLSSFGHGERSGDGRR